jgi:hypothetical protein
VTLITFSKQNIPDVARLIGLKDACLCGSGWGWGMKEAAVAGSEKICILLVDIHLDIKQQTQIQFDLYK